MEKINHSPNLIAVTKSDTTVYDPPLIGIRVGTTAGDIKVRSGSDDVILVGVQVGETVYGSFNMVYSTDTTAVGMNGYQWNDLV